MDHTTEPLQLCPNPPRLDDRVRLLIAECEDGTFLKVTPTLATLASDYGSRKGWRRPSADPLGVGGLPDHRGDLNAMLMELCRRLVTAGGRIVRGVAVDRLIDDMFEDEE